jgi:hypothetical protein
MAQLTGEDEVTKMVMLGGEDEIFKLGEDVVATDRWLIRCHKDFSFDFLFPLSFPLLFVSSQRRFSNCQD